MHWIDIVLFLWIAISLYSGWKMGFIYKLGSLIGLGASIYFASRWTPWLVERFDLSWTWVIIIFFILVSLLSQLFGLVAWLIDKVFHIVYIIPFTKTTNRFFGAVLSFIVTFTIIAATAYVASLVPWSDAIINALHHSIVLKIALMVAYALTPFVSDVLSQFISARFLP